MKNNYKKYGRSSFSLIKWDGSRVEVTTNNFGIALEDLAKYLGVRNLTEVVLEEVVIMTGKDEYANENLSMFYGKDKERNLENSYNEKATEFLRYVRDKTGRFRYKNSSVYGDAIIMWNWKHD